MAVSPCDWIITNPPYRRPTVDLIANDVLAMVRGGYVKGAAMLMRSNWDLAQRRTELFASPYYRGQTRLRFRPWWSEDRKCQPIHAYSWQVWTTTGEGPAPVVRYWPLPSVAGGGSGGDSPAVAAA